MRIADPLVRLLMRSSTDEEGKVDIKTMAVSKKMNV